MVAPICTRRLVLRPIGTADAEAHFALFNNWNVVRWLSQPPWPYTLDDAFAYAGAAEARRRDREEALVITLEDVLIGSIVVRMRPASHLQRTAGPNIGFWLGEPYWGRGYMTEAAAGFARHIFATCADDAVYAGAFAANHASLRVQEKLGFIRDGETTLHSRPRGCALPHVNMTLTRAAFDAASA